MRLDPTSFTTPEEQLELMVAKQFGKLHVPTRGEVRKFTAIALTDAIPMSDLAFSNFIGSDPDLAADAQSRFIVKAMIVADELGERLGAKNNPHRKLPNPCLPTAAENVNKAISTIMLYTTFLTARGFTMTQGESIRKNDEILVSLTVESNGHLQIERGQIVSLVRRSEEAASDFTQCVNLSRLFDSHTGTTVSYGAFSDSSITPRAASGIAADSSALENCVKAGYDTKNPSIPVRKDVGSNKYTTEEVIRAIMSTSYSDEVKKLLYVFTKIEQPSFSFPGNNPGGIQTDGRALSYSQITYQFCKKDAHQYRVFAGFDNLKDAFEVKGAMLKYKIENDSNYTSMTEDSVEGDLDTLHMNYYRVWNFSASKSDYDQIVKYGYFSRSGKVVPSKCVDSGATSPPSKVLIGKSGCKSPIAFKTRLRGILTDWYKISKEGTS